MSHSLRQFRSLGRISQVLVGFTTVLLSVASSLCMAQSAISPDSVRQAVLNYTKGDLKIATVSPTPAGNVFEVVTADSNEIIYVDGTGRYAFIEGALVDLSTRANLTQMRLAKLQSIDFNALPLDRAIKTVVGKGTHKLAIFEDPACMHCRAMRKLIDQFDDVTIYAFPYPVIAESSVIASKSTMCAPAAQREKLWASTMATGKLASGINAVAKNATCGAAVDQFMALGLQLKITGTPTVFLQNGERIAGAVPPHEFVKRFELAMK